MSIRDRLRAALVMAKAIISPPRPPMKVAPPAPPPPPWPVPARAIIHCDQPSLVNAPASLAGVLEVAGFALAMAGVREVFVFIDDLVIGQGVLGIARPDVSRVHSEFPDASRSGFYMPADVSGLAAGSHRLRVRVLGNEGDVAEAAGDIIIDPALEAYPAASRGSVVPPDQLRALRNRCVGAPLFSFLVTVGPENLQPLEATISSLQAQAFEKWELVIARSAPIPEGGFKDQRIRWLEGEILGQVAGDWFGVLDAGDCLLPHALVTAALFLDQSPATDLMYSDEDVSGRTVPFFKPDWSPELLLGMNYIGRLWLARTHLVRQLGELDTTMGPAGELDLLLRLTERTNQIGHLRTVLYTRGKRPDGYGGVHGADGQKALTRACARRGIEAQVEETAIAGLFHVRRALPRERRVTIIIPTRGPMHHLRPLMASIRRLSFEAPEIILLISDADEISEELAELAKTHDCRVLRYDFPFNWSRVNNVGAAAATGDYFLFMNDDMEVLQAGWLEALLEQAQIPEVGAVGAKLLYPGDTLQHAGIFLVPYGGGARHSFRCMPAMPSQTSPVPPQLGLLGAVRNCIAVTGACIMTRRDLFAKVRGFDETFGLVCNDVDFCLRVWEAGYRVVWTPHAVLRHFELVTRKDLSETEDVGRFWARWGEQLDLGDPFFNPNLSGRSDLHLASADPADPIGRALGTKWCAKLKQGGGSAVGQ